MRHTLILILLSLAAVTCSAGERRVEITDATINGNDYMAVLDPVWYSVNIYDGPDRYEKDLTRFSREQRLALACAWYRAEVNNGGHHQFYSNSTGIVWKDAIACFKAIGADEVAALVEESARQLGGNPSLDRAEREKQMERLSPDFEDLDNRFYALEEKLGLDAKLMEYIRRNREKFYFSGMVPTE